MDGTSLIFNDLEPLAKQLNCVGSNNLAISTIIVAAIIAISNRIVFFIFFTKISLNLLKKGVS
jgi:hypothetical protein